MFYEVFCQGFPFTGAGKKSNHVGEGREGCRARFTSSISLSPTLIQVHTCVQQQLHSNFVFCLFLNQREK